MEKRDVRQYEMLVRVRDFGIAQAALFPESTLATDAFATIDEAVKQLSKYTGSKVMSTRGSAKTKAAARKALLATVRAFGRTARGIAAHDPAFQNKFQVPRRHPGPVLLTLARSFAQHAEPLRALFIARGMRPTFIADLNARADAYEAAIRARARSEEERSEAEARIQAALDSGLAAARQLDLVVANHLGSDAGLLARWKESRRVPYPKYPRGPALPPPAVPTAAGPPPLDTPTAMVASTPTNSGDVAEDDAA